jgi:hypothetical protein
MEVVQELIAGDASAAARTALRQALLRSTSFRGFVRDLLRDDLDLRRAGAGAAFASAAAPPAPDWESFRRRHEDAGRQGTDAGRCPGPEARS